MSLHNLAHHVRAKGRGKDSMLVHMTPREVQGLQALAKSRGGTLTINPETGLPEAGFLDQILPMVAMAAATYFTAGAAAPALAGALTGVGGMSAATAATAGGILAGAGSGALYGGIGAGLKGGDVGKGALMGGLGGAISGGMGAYDNVFSAAGATDAGSQLVNVPPGTVGEGVGAGASSIPADELVKQQTTQQTTDLATRQAAAQADPTRALVAEPPGTVIESQVGQPPPGMRLNEFGDAYRPGVPTPSAVDDKTKAEAAKTVYQGFGPMGKTAALALPGIGGAMGEKPDQVPGLEPYSSQSTLSPDFQGYTPPQPNPYYRAQYTRYAAGGGLMDAYQAGGPVERMSQMNTAMNPQGGLYPQGMIDKTQYAVPTQRPVSSEMVMDAPAYERSNPMLMSSGGDTRKKKRASLTADRTISALDPYNAAIAQLNNARYGANMSGIGALNPSMTSLGELPITAGAKGGIADLGGFSDGGRMLKGPGDGMSDSIPATIANKRPARLADGEFVVPADVVSHLGNGSTDAGARKLYSMMDKIRKARTGKKKQAPAVNTGRFMPA
jgi:hypothetical protein